MERTEESQFLIQEPDNSSIFSSSVNKHLWFEVIGGEDEGIRVCVPLPPFESTYDNAVSNTLQDLQDGDIVTAVLEREEDSDSWTPISLTFEQNIK